jgi:Eukaryotic glutathione synthase, ATP binding domain
MQVIVRRCADRLECFVDSAKDVDTLLQCFAGLWGLDDLDEPRTASVIESAIREPDMYILKPQREGGGNNLYGASVRPQALLEEKLPPCRVDDAGSHVPTLLSAEGPDSFFSYRGLSCQTRMSGCMQARKWSRCCKKGGRRWRLTY